MSYKTKRVFIKNANGTYTEIDYEEFRSRKAADKSLSKRENLSEFLLIRLWKPMKPAIIQ